MKILLKIGYLGTAYAGFQVQKNAVTVQQTLQDAVERVFGRRYPVTGCSRTDSGVHAREFYCTIDADGYSGGLAEKTAQIPYALNSLLPDDISVFYAKTVDDSFHVRYNVLYKEYEYLIWNQREKNPFFAQRAYHYPKKLDTDKMSRAANCFCGTHDFSAFMSSGSNVKSTVRTVKYCNVSEENGFVKVNIASDGFLYNMVRIIVGTLIAVSEEKIAENSVPEIIALRDRSKAGTTAPADGLYLNRVVYRETESN